MATSHTSKTAACMPRCTIASYPSYSGAERAVDWLADQRFAVEGSAIVRSVALVAGRMTPSRAALIGACEGALTGALFALLFGIFFTGPDFAELLLCGLLVGGFVGAAFGVVIRSEVQVDEGAADEATRVLGAIPAAPDTGDR
jgi:uncharacterized protein YqgC (DUF456 family)